MQNSKNFVGKKVDDFVLIDILGTGAFGQVFTAQNMVTKETVAIKSVPKTKLKEHNGLVGQLLNTEVSVLMQCNNMNVVKMMKYLESENNCYLVMEYCNQGDLEQRWKKNNRRFPENEAIQYLKQILNGMKGLHEMNVIHRDLKLPNILISNNTLKIGDLGFAKRLDSKEQLVKDALGTLGTMAPEVIEFKPYGLLADIFSLGAIYYQMLFGVLPFSIRSYEDFLRDVKSTQPNLTKDGVIISDASKDLIQKMLCYDPKVRINWSQLYEHQLFQDEKNQIGSLNQKLTVQHIVSKQIDYKQNKEMYQQNQEQFKSINDQNMMDKIKIKQVQGQKIEEQQCDVLQLAQKERQNIQLKDEELNFAIEEYLAERNTLVFLGTLLHEIHAFKHSQNVNVFLPAFMIVKKLIIEVDTLLNRIKRQENIFQCKYFMDLYLHPQFKQFYKILDDDHKVVQEYFNIILQSITMIFQKMPQANEKYVKELKSQPSQDFNINFRDSLLDYYFQLQEENSMTHEDSRKNQINNIMIYVLDAISFDKGVKEQIRYKQVDAYFEEFNFMTEKEKDDLINIKFTLAYG